MRLWHKYLIPYLPRKQLLGQWRECCLIAKKIHENGTPGHILVNRIMDFPEDEFNAYTNAVIEEMKRRGYHVDIWRFYRWRNDINDVMISIAFRGWHTDRYLKQCLNNLQEKYDCGGITNEEWDEILHQFGSYLNTSN